MNRLPPHLEAAFERLQSTWAARPMTRAEADDLLKVCRPAVPAPAAELLDLTEARAAIAQVLAAGETRPLHRPT